MFSRFGCYRGLYATYWGRYPFNIIFQKKNFRKRMPRWAHLLMQIRGRASSLFLKWVSLRHLSHSKNVAFFSSMHFDRNHVKIKFYNKNPNFKIRRTMNSFSIGFWYQNRNTVIFTYSQLSKSLHSHFVIWETRQQK